MRLIDADEIMKALSIFNDTTNGNIHFINGIETAKELIEDAPTVYTSDWMNEMMMEDERLKKEQKDDTDTTDSEIHDRRWKHHSDGCHP